MASCSHLLHVPTSWNSYINPDVLFSEKAAKFCLAFLRAFLGTAHWCVGKIRRSHKSYFLCVMGLMGMYIIIL